MNEKRPSLPPPRTRPLEETLPVLPPPAARRRRRVLTIDPSMDAAALPLEEEFTPKRLIRSVLGFLFITAVLGGLLYIYMQSMEKEAKQADVVAVSLRGMAQELWVKGTAAGLSTEDPKLTAAITRIKTATGILPAISVLPADGGTGNRAATHELLYTSGNKSLLRVRVFANLEAGSVDIVSFTPAPQFKEDAPKPPADSLQEKLKKFGISEKVLEDL